MTEDKKMSTSEDDHGHQKWALQDRMGQFYVKSHVQEMLSIQLEELEMLQSMFSNPGEFEIHDHSVIANINEFLGGDSGILPPQIDFTIHLIIDDKKLEVYVNLPLEYPADEPGIFVRNDSLSRTQQHELNSDLSKYICSLNRGEICIYPTIAWLQENGPSYFITSGKVAKPKTHSRTKTDVNKLKQFSRYWIYSHHINHRRNIIKCILDLASEYGVTGFCLPGKPGIICIEGWETDCKDCWLKIRSMNWQKIICKKQEEEWVPTDTTLESLRKFTGFLEISFDSGKTRALETDMGKFYKYLSDHDCNYVFRDLFGVEGKAVQTHKGASVN